MGIDRCHSGTAYAVQSGKLSFGMLSLYIASKARKIFSAEMGPEIIYYT